jgi:hypothetical protein
MIIIAVEVSAFIVAKLLDDWIEDTELLDKTRKQPNK